jgi:hypothetical protein
MVGAPAMVAMGALRAGAGLAKVVMPAPILTAGLTICPSATGVPLAVDQATGEIIAHEAASARALATRRRERAAATPRCTTVRGLCHGQRVSLCAVCLPHQRQYLRSSTRSGVFRFDFVDW